MRVFVVCAGDLARFWVTRLTVDLIFRSEIHRARFYAQLLGVFYFLRSKLGLFGRPARVFITAILVEVYYLQLFLVLPAAASNGVFRRVWFLRLFARLRHILFGRSLMVLQFLFLLRLLFGLLRCLFPLKCYLVIYILYICWIIVWLISLQQVQQFFYFISSYRPVVFMHLRSNWEL